MIPKARFQILALVANMGEGSSETVRLVKLTADFLVTLISKCIYHLMRK